MRKYLTIFCFGILLVGCSGGRQNLYTWDGEYERSMYQYLNEEGDLRTQISNLQSSILRTKTRGGNIAPGLYAHLGVLYSAIGDDGKAKECFETEKTLFPQSRKYMEFLQNKNAKVIKK